MDTEKLLTHFGNINAVCSNLDVSRATFYLWKKKGISIERQIKIEVATNGAIRADLPASVRQAA